MTFAPDHRTTGIIDREHIASIAEHLEKTPKARALFQEFTDPEKLREGIKVGEVIAAIRHKVYDLGLLGGPDEIEKEAIETTKTIPDSSERYQQKLIRKSIAAFKTLAELSEETRDNALGMIRGRYLQFDPEETENKYFEPNNEGMKKTVLENTPLNELFHLIALYEKKRTQSPETDLLWHEAAARSASEHLIRRLMTRNEQLIELASRLFNKQYYEIIFQQMPEALSQGKIGGKALGYLLGNAGIEYPSPEFDEIFLSKLPKHMKKTIRTTENLRRTLALNECLYENFSEFIGSGVFEETTQHNEALRSAPLIKEFYKADKNPPEGLHEKIQTAYETAKFPPHIERQLKMLFAKRHGRPIIVRSSSELEDRHGASFAGQYKSFELANNGDFETDFGKFKKAILGIYASVYSPDVMEYRRKKGLLRENEEMGILIQNLNGEQHGDYFYPDLSVVAMSYATQSLLSNESNGSETINMPEQGAMRIAAGLGRIIVDEAGGRYVMFGKPTATFDIQEKNPQSACYAVNFKSGKVEKANAKTLLTDTQCSLGLCQIRGNGNSTFSFKDILKEKGSLLPLQLEYIVQKLKYLWGCNVDCEFNLQWNRKEEKWMIQLVQCRPQNIPKNLKPSRIPETVPEKHIVMHAENSANGTCLENISHVVYIDPKIFTKCTPKERQWVQKYVKSVNETLETEKYLIIAPRSWGSKEENSGLSVDFGDFSNAAGVMEVWEQGESAPSFGAHFFQVFGDCNMAFSACSKKDFSKNFEDGAQNFFEAASHCRELPTPAELSGIPEPIGEKLSQYIKIIDVNTEYQQLFNTSNSQHMRLHLAQDNTGTSDRSCPAVLYFAEENKETPKPVNKANSATQ